MSLPVRQEREGSPIRLTYSGLLNSFLDDTGNSGSTDSTLTAFFKRKLASRYQLVQSKLSNWLTQQQKTFSTVASQQYYHNPVGFMNIETVTITVGSIAYPLTPVDSQLNWDRINEVLISTSAIPQFFFQRRDDFGIWPIPQGVYTGTLNHSNRDRSLTNTDYTTGTITATNNSQTITGAGTTFTAGMIGRWLQVTNDGYWYRISAFTDTTHVTLETSYEGTTASGQTYTIGESPEIPEELHDTLSAGVVADYYAGLRQDVEKGTWWNNVFWTGDGNNSVRTGPNISGGVIGGTRRYASRSNSKIIKRGEARISPNKSWAETIS